HPSGRILSFLDRVFFSAESVKPNPFAFKPGASIAVARRGGTTASFDVLNKYFGISQMPIAGSTYWNISHGLVAEDAKQDEEGMQTMRNLARNMVWMMRSFAVAKEQGVPYPDTDKEKKVSTNFVR
ncbi:MAG: flavodoxin family protein, partial [Veillonella dispar]|nr:flavodoxin family protein [Veillonella dispar]